ncbi:type IV secretion system protein [Novosphingobium sp.]|uniref:type IV secretion system protein n=1 Tax=Novosphingobium sp. TaxID=1874826 RepID=UPI00261D9328|nr:type IV secretion system protein [Novosphingobium sp.]
MSCATHGAIAADSIAASLRYVDCLSASTAAEAFGRLFGRSGSLTGVLTALLTLYVGLLAAGLLSGRARLGLGGLTPRITALGLILTFATSWAAYQTVIWSLLTGGPDQIAAIVLGIKGSASEAFARRLDLVFAAVLDAAAQAHATQGDAKGTTPGDLLSSAALILLLGTVGVLVTARIALAAMLATGPVFIALALFPATRGLFEGWLKVTVAFALVPLFAVLLGAGALAMIVPVLSDIGDGAADMRQAAAVLVAAVVHAALMVLSLRLVTTLVQAWRITPTDTGRSAPDHPAASSGRPMVPIHDAGPGAIRGWPEPRGGGRDERVQAIVAASAGRPGPALLPSPGSAAWSGGPVAPFDPATHSAARAGEIVRALARKAPTPTPRPNAKGGAT